MVSANLCLFKQRCDQAISQTTVLHAFTHGINTWIKSLHGVADNDAAFTVQADLFRQFDIGFDAYGHHHQVGRRFSTVLEAYGFDHVLAEDGFRLCFHQEFYTALLERSLEQGRGGFVELAFHE